MKNRLKTRFATARQRMRGRRVQAGTARSIAASATPVNLNDVRARLLKIRAGAAKASSRRDLESIEVELSKYARELEKKHMLEPVELEFTLLRQRIFHRIVGEGAACI